MVKNVVLNYSTYAGSARVKQQRISTQSMRFVGVNFHWVLMAFHTEHTSCVFTPTRRVFTIKICPLICPLDRHPCGDCATKHERLCFLHAACARVWCEWCEEAFSHQTNCALDAKRPYSIVSRWIIHTKSRTHTHTHRALLIVVRSPFMV